MGNSLTPCCGDDGALPPLLFTLATDGTSLADGTRGLQPKSVRVNFGAENDRKHHARTEAMIDNVWKAKLAENPNIFDGHKFRLANCCWSSDRRRIVLEVGCTGYREYLGTHGRSDGQYAALVAAGLREHRDESAHLACALGVETVLETADGAVVLLRRSAAVSGNRGQYNGPSGHPEPTKVKMKGAVEDSIAKRQLSDTGVQKEIFDSIVQETVEETGVAREHLGEPVLIGGMLDERRKPDLLFHMKTDLDADEVREAFAAGAPEGWESDRIAFVRVRVVRNLGPKQDWLVAPQEDEIELESFDGEDDVAEMTLTPVTRCALYCDAVRRR